MQVGVAVDHADAAGSPSFGEQRLERTHALDLARRRTGRRRTRQSGPRAPRAAARWLGEVGVQQHRHDPESLRERAQHAVEIVRVRGVLRQLPRRLLLDVAVEPAHALPDLVERAGQLDAVEQLRDALAQALEVVVEQSVEFAFGERAVAVAHDHRDRAAREVAVVVGQLALVALLEGGGGDRAVLAEGHVAQQVEAQRVGAEAVDHLERVEHVAERLAHLLAVHQQVAVHEHPLGQLDPGGHQQRRPVHRVEAQDVLGDQVHVRRPELLGEVEAARRAAPRPPAGA